MYASEMYDARTYAGKTYDREIGNCNRLSHPHDAKKKMTGPFAINDAITTEPFSCQGIARR